MTTRNYINTNNIAALRYKKGRPLFQMDLFKCENCGHKASDLMLNSFNVNCGFFRCTKCDTFYELSYMYKDTVSSTAWDSQPSFTLKIIDKKSAIEQCLDYQGNSQPTILDI